MGLFDRSTPRKSWWRRFRDYANNCVTSGFIPTDNRTFRRIGKFGAKVWSFVQVGKVTIVGEENLHAPGRLIFCPNHSAMLDAIVIYPYIPDGTRFMSAVEEMRGFWGLKGIVMGALGSYAVDRSRGKSVIAPSINVLVSGRCINMFPEGKISPTGEYLEFKRGAAWIAMGACEALQHKELVGIVPVQICYGTRDVSSALDFGKMRLKWRAGVTITVGKPVYLHDINPLTPDAVMARIKDEITSRDCPTTSLPDKGD